jgi:DNA-binding NarL/FixJ family response regulator
VNYEEAESSDASPHFLLVEDDKAYARSIARVLRRSGDVIMAGTVSEAKAAIGAQKWSATIVDLGLPDGSGLEVLDVVQVVQPATPILVLTGSLEVPMLNRVCEFGLWIKFAVKPVSGSLLESFVQLVAAFGERLVAATNLRCDQWFPEPRRDMPLSRREREVLELALLGYRNKAIACKLGLTESSVSVLICRAKTKFNVRSRQELLRRITLLSLREDGARGRALAIAVPLGDDAYKRKD